MKNNFSILKVAAIIAVAFVTFATTSCKKGVDITFTQNFSSINFVVKQTTQQGSITMSGVNVNTGISQLASDKGFNINDLKSAKIKTCTLTINDTILPHVTFAMIDSISAQLSSTGLSTVTIANNAGTLSGSTLSMNLNSVDVAPYIKANTFSFQVIGHTNAPVPHDVPMNAAVTFEITASVTK